jgi:hypothetical protein
MGRTAGRALGSKLACPIYAGELAQGSLPMNETEALNDAFAAMLGSLYRKLFEDFAQAESDAAKRTEAEARFQRGLALAREAHERAVALL